MRKYKCILLIGFLLAGTSAMAAEPEMSDYTAFPVFSNQSVAPNVMIILDNSGSMNWNAYGTWPGSGGTVKDQPYAGEPYGGTINVQIRSGMDDVEELTTNDAELNSGSDDLDFGGYETTEDRTYVGIRFPGIEIPQGATITNAYIDFVARRNETIATSLTIEGEDSGNAAPFDFDDDTIKNRTPVGETVPWTPGGWTRGQNYQTPDISAIVQAVVNRGDWNSGNAMVFRFSGTGKRDARSREYGSSSAPVLRIQFDGGETIRYYGIFNPDGFYIYDNNNGQFQLAYKKTGFDSGGNRWNVKDLNGAATTLSSTAIVNGGLWDGNWLNWATMRRIDVLRKVLFGGDTANGGDSGRDGSGVQTLYSENDSSYWYRWFDSSSNIAVNPYHDNYQYRMRYADIRVDGVDYNVRVEKNEAHEPEAFINHNLAGIIQNIGDKARWGNIWFRSGSGNNNHGGFLENAIGTDIDDIVDDLEARDPSTWTPLAETFYVAMQYFRQEMPEISGFNALLDSTKGDANDPYFRDGEPVPCAKSFVILLTDGASTKDANIPSAYKDTDGDDDNTNCDESSESNCDYPSGGTDFLDDVALYAHTNDLRPDLEDTQSIALYTIYAFGNDDDARNLLRDASRSGGFEDRDGDNLPDGDYSDPPEDRLEWDEDGDGEPDTYFEANDGYAMEARLLEAITDILKRASSGTAASVLATNSVGAGNSVQAYFRPVVSVGLEEARWLGYLESLWVDPWGNLREDTNGNLKLDLKNTNRQNTAETGTDLIVEFITDNADTIARRYTSHFLYNPDNGDSGTCAMDTADCTVVWEDISMDAVTSIFEAGSRLSNRDLSTNPRKIFTYVGPLDAPNNDMKSFDTSGDVIAFDTDMLSDLKPYFGLADRGNTGRWNDYGSTEDDRATNLITYIQGTDVSGLRNRTLAGTTWRLGDIVHSTPIVVARPSERFHQLYNNKRYAEFLAEFKDRETMIYVGGNDGMLHAFTNWQYQEDSDGNPEYVQPAVARADELIGDELWAYIPQSLLPHLKWLGLPDYTHTYFVDGEPRVFDADILPNGTHYNGTGNNFGTFLIMGLGMGGKTIDLNADLDGDGIDDTMSPTYILLDITNPRDPRLMWERTYQNLGMSYSVPAPVRVDGKWFLVFGSGPTEYDGSSAHGGYVYVVDLATGQPYGSGTEDWLYDEDELGNNGNASFNDPLALDIFQSANADAIYFAKNYYSNNSWKSDIYKIAVPCFTGHCPWDGVGEDDIQYDSDPSAWILSKLFESDRPVAVKLASSTDPVNNVFLYFGTGRYLYEDDKVSTEQQYLYGIKDPFYNKALDEKNGNHYHNFSLPCTLTRDDLFDSNPVKVTTGGYVTGLPSGKDQEFFQFVKTMRSDENEWNGWYISLNTNDPEPSERIITRSAILGGIVLTPTFIPNSDICGMGGSTELLGVYYETGTGFTRQIFNIDNPDSTTITINNCDGTTSSDTQEVVAIRDDRLLKGTPAPKIVFHVGLQEGANSKLQMSTRGEGGGFTDPALNFKSTITEWWDNE